MPIPAQSRLGPYEILEEIGAGGMGEVYRARDSRLDRTVAIKVLPSQLVNDPDAKQRFEREARAISAVQHPHICTLFDIGSEDGIEFLVMEYLEGETLAARLERGPLSLKEVVRIGSEIALALDKAHKHGVLHRDLKPGNIMLTRSGAKLLDFGLAKPFAMASTSASTFRTAPAFSAATMSAVSPITQVGTIVGTVQYMSPEQIEGKEADARSDIFSLGCVLYEMATGKRAFEGKSNLSIASAILEKDPEAITASRPLAPPALEHVIRRCLEKNPDDRWQSAADVRAELIWTETSSATMKALRSHHLRRAPLYIALASVIALALGVLLGYALRKQKVTPLVQAAIPPPEASSFVLGRDDGSLPTISPGGSSVAFTVSTGGKRAIFIRSFNAANAIKVPGTENGSYPFWSPDAKSLGFFAEGKLRRVDINTGIVTDLAPTPNGRGGAWNAEGTIVYSPDFRLELYSIPAIGGVPKKLTTLTAEHTSHRWPSFLPDGKHFLYSAINHNMQFGPQNGIYVGSLDGSPPVRLVHSIAQGLYAGGQLFYLNDQKIVAHDFDPKTLKLSGEPQLMVSGVQSDADTWTAAFGVSESGALVYQSGTGYSVSSLEWFDANGRKVSNFDQPRPYLHLYATRDGKYLAADVGQVDGKIWVGSRERNALTKLTFGDRQDTNPIISPDGKWVMFGSIFNNVDKFYHFKLVMKPLNGVGDEQVLTGDDANRVPVDWSQDGKYVLFQEGELGAPVAFKLLPMFGTDRTPRPILNTEGYEADGQLSPNGKWVAYLSPQSGQLEVYVSPVVMGDPKEKLTIPKGRWQVSQHGAVMHRWSADGKELFFVDTDRNVNSVSVQERDGSFEFGAPRILFRVPNIRGLNAQQMLTTPDRKFLFNTVELNSDKPLSYATDWRQLLNK